MDLADLLQRVHKGPWPQRIAAIRSVPAEFAGKEHQAVYAAVARDFYAEHLGPHFHIVPWPDPYIDHPAFIAAYQAADDLTGGFTKTTPADIEARSERTRAHCGSSGSSLATRPKSCPKLSITSAVFDSAKRPSRDWNQAPNRQGESQRRSVRSPS